MLLKYTKIIHTSLYFNHTIKNKNHFTDNQINKIIKLKYYAYLQTKPETNKQSSA